MGKILGKKYRVEHRFYLFGYPTSLVSTVEEIYLPDLGIAINSKGEIFEACEERYRIECKAGVAKKVGYVEIDEKDGLELKNHMLQERKVENLIKKYFKP